MVFHRLGTGSNIIDSRATKHKATAVQGSVEPFPPERWMQSRAMAAIKEKRKAASPIFANCAREPPPLERESHCASYRDQVKTILSGCIKRLYGNPVPEVR